MADGAQSSTGLTETETEGDAGKEQMESFRVGLLTHFSSLTNRGVGANEAAALALRITSGRAQEPLTARELLDTLRGATVAARLDTAARMVAATFTSPDRLSAMFSQAGAPQPLSSGINFPVLWEVYNEVLQVGNDAVTGALMHSTDILLAHLLAEAEQAPAGWADVPANSLRPLLIILENPLLMEPDYHPQLEKLTAALVALPADGQLRLVKIFESFTRRQFEHIRDVLQQLITINLYESYHHCGAAVECATKVLGFLFAANEKAMALPHTAFYNDAVNDEEFNVEEDYSRSKQCDRFGFSFCDHSFVYDAASKSKILQLDSQLQMMHQFEDAMLRSIFVGPTARGASCPFNVLRIRRDHLIQDAIAQVLRRAEDLKKPLKVQFVGEEGIDEGGVQKEFFQLVVREVFDPKYGMFSFNEETGLYWFNASLDDMQLEYELIGMVLSLAIYNNNILEFRFPNVIYKKLLGKRLSLSDLAAVNPGLAKGLQDFLEFTGDVEATYLRSFQVSEEDLFGGITTVDLKEGGGDVAVTAENRREYVDLCMRHFLETSIARPFDAFARGFLHVCGGPILGSLHPEELEQLICGSPVLDFHALESCTRYESGYHRDSRIIRDFWELVHAFSEDQKKKLLFFTTGSDRAPIKVLATLPFVISRNGPDSHRLPTAHTCFNHLLLPDYSTKEKMREKLIMAITNAEGFGLM